MGYHSFWIGNVMVEDGLVDYTEDPLEGVQIFVIQGEGTNCTRSIEVTIFSLSRV